MPTLKRNSSFLRRASRCCRSFSSTRWPNIALYDGGVEKQGEYAQIFEEEYTTRLNEILTLEDSAVQQIPARHRYDADT